MKKGSLINILASFTLILGLWMLYSPASYEAGATVMKEDECTKDYYCKSTEGDSCCGESKCKTKKNGTCCFPTWLGFC